MITLLASEDATGSGTLLVQSDEITAPAGSFVVGSIAFGLADGAYDSAAGTMSFTPGLGWSEDTDGPVSSGHPSTWVGHRTGDGGSVRTEATHSGVDPVYRVWGAQIAAFAAGALVQKKSGLGNLQMDAPITPGHGLVYAASFRVGAGANLWTDLFFASRGYVRVRPATPSSGGDETAIYYKAEADVGESQFLGGVSSIPGAGARGTWFELEPASDPEPPAPGPIVDVYDPDDVFLATLPAKDVRIRVELNGVGAGAFKINRYAAEATAEILRPRNYVRVTIPQIDPDPIFGFFLDDGDFTLVSSSERGGEDIAFEGKGALSYWTRAIWLAESFLQPWWPAYLDTGDPQDPGPPEAEDIGAIALNTGDYIDYGVSGGAVVSETTFHTDDMSAYYDEVRTFTRSGGRPPITLVHLSSGFREGDWVHSSGTGVTRYPKKSVYAFGNSVLMESIDDGDKPGQVLVAMYQEAFDAGRPINPIPRMTIDFDATEDSNGDPWSTTDALKAVSAALGDDYLSTVGKLIETGVIDVEMDPDLGMHAYNQLGVDRSSTVFAAGKVRFAKGVNIADELTREFADAPSGTFAEVIGPNEGDVGRATITPPAGHPPREISVRGDSSDVAALEALGVAELERRLLHSDALGFNVATPRIGFEDELAGLYVPGPPGSANGKYWPGDVVTLHTGEGENDFDNVDVRIAAITMWFGSAGDLRHGVEVGSSLGGLRVLGYPGSSGGGPTSAGGSAGGGSSTGGGTSDLYQRVDERDQAEGYPSLDENARVDYRAIETSWKMPVRTVSLTPLAIATGFVPGQTVGGVVLAEGDAVLVAGQTDASENGIRVVLASGAPARRRDMRLGSDVLGAAVLVFAGTGAGKIYRATNTTAPVLETDDVLFAIASGEASVDGSSDTHVWMPLTSVLAGEPVLVWDGDDSLIPTLVPLD